MISGSTDLVNAGGKMAAKGSLKITDAVVHNVQVGYPITADFDVTDDLKNDVLTIKKADMKLGSTPLSLNGTLNTHATPGTADLNISAKDASIEDAARLAAAFGVAFSPNAKITGKLSANLHAQGPTDNLALNGTVNGRNLEVTGKDIPRGRQGAVARPHHDAAGHSLQPIHCHVGRHHAVRPDDHRAIHLALAFRGRHPEDRQRQSG